MNAVRLGFALVAFAAGALAAVAGAPRPPLAADEVSAVELATWIRDRRAALVVVDTRSSEAFDDGRVPGARALADLDVATLDAGATLVIVADRDADADIVAAVRRDAGQRRVLRLRGGFAAWNSDVLYPAVRGDASARQRREYDERAALALWFGGAPRRVDAGATLPGKRSRRGC